MFDSSTAFRLPSSAVRSGDGAFVSHERWQVLTPDERKQFPPICPDFVVELMSGSDTIADARAKTLADWMGNSWQLAWLIDLKTKTTYIHRADGSIHINHGFQEPLPGEGVLPGFALYLNELAKRKKPRSCGSLRFANKIRSILTASSAPCNYRNPPTYLLFLLPDLCFPAAVPTNRGG